MPVMRAGHGYAGTGVARLLGLLCPLLLLSLLLLRAFLPLPEPMRWLWAASMVACALSGAVALILLLFGPWQNRLAGFGLGLVVAALLFARDSAWALAAQVSRLL